MPRVPTFLLALVLGAAIHLDFHLARPTHHRLSLGWPYHWIVAAAIFAAVGWVIARRWPEQRWRMGIAVFVVGVFLGQGVEPVLEELLYAHRIGYATEPERWAAFWTSMLVSTPAFFAALWLCARRPRLVGAT